MSLWCFTSSFSSIQLSVWEAMSFEYRNGTILAIPNRYITPMPPIKFRLNLTYGFGGDIVWRISRWLWWWPSCILEMNNFSNSESLSLMLHIKFWLNPTFGLGGDVVWISEWNNLSNSESLYHSDASHKVLAQSNLKFGRRCRLKNFKMAAMDIGMEQS